MKKERDESIFKRFVLPVFAILACGFMVFAAIYAHGITPYLTAKANGTFACPIAFYLIVFAVIMAAGVIFRKPRK
jgi:APA family basic amino acid/polyamine antiporter